MSNLKYINISGLVNGEVIKYWGKNPKISFVYQDNLKLNSLYLGERCCKCGGQKCNCGLPLFRTFSLPDLKEALGWREFKTLKPYLIHRRFREVMYVSGISFNIVGSRKLLVFVTNDEGYIQVKILD